MFVDVLKQRLVSGYFYGKGVNTQGTDDVGLEAELHRVGSSQQATVIHKQFIFDFVVFSVHEVDVEFASGQSFAEILYC